MDRHLSPLQPDSPPTSGGRREPDHARGQASGLRLPLAALPPGFMDRAMARIRMEAAEGRARAIITAPVTAPVGQAPVGATGRSPTHTIQATDGATCRSPLPTVIRTQRRRETAVLAMALVLGLLVAAGLGWLLSNLDPVQLAQQRLALRQGLFELRLLIHTQPYWLLGASALLAVLGLALASAGDRPSTGLRVVGRQA